jgi:uncharacterized peroxidase-related enzyme
MPYVNEIEASQADAHLSEIYRKIEQKFGFLPHYFMALGAKPDVIEGQSKLNVAIMQDGALTEAFKEQIGVVVSGINASSYCIAIHMELLRRFGVEKPLARKLATDYGNAPVEEKARALFRFADKLTSGHRRNRRGRAAAGRVGRCGHPRSGADGGLLQLHQPRFLRAGTRRRLLKELPLQRQDHSPLCSSSFATSAVQPV